ncbi:MAG: SDR family oxidoreductase [Acidiphilium sp.]|nr:SDR family oxidoreductase [Acidiphilium sp.]MDD4936758.1 SDR family oxidoreductase [Acidiphilium sp.]
MTDHLVIAGLGFTGRAIAIAARDSGMRVTATTRDPAGKHAPPGIALIGFAAAGPAIAAATHLVVTAAPAETGDPVLTQHRAALDAAAGLRWIGYCSTTGVYGDHQGGTVDEATIPTPGSDRTRRRVACERAWMTLADRRAIDCLRLAGIYGPGRSAFDDLRRGTARRIDKPGHRFSRIHVTDIARATLAAMATAGQSSRIFNLSDDEPASSASVTAYAAALLGMDPPPLIGFEDAKASLSPMALSFWGESRVVRSAATKATLGLSWRYPSYREGLTAILQAERGTLNPGNGPDFR